MAESLPPLPPNAPDDPSAAAVFSEPLTPQPDGETTDAAEVAAAARRIRDGRLQLVNHPETVTDGAYYGQPGELDQNPRQFHRLPDTPGGASAYYSPQLPPAARK